MITPELVQFIKSELNRGSSKELIIDRLKTQGWTDVDIFEAFNSISKPPSAVPDIIPTSPYASSPVTQEQSKRRILPKILLTILILIILTASAGFAYAFGYITPLDKVFSNSMQTLQNKNGATFETNITIDTSGLKSAQQSLSMIPGSSNITNIDINGSYDASNKEDIKFDSSFAFKSGTFEMQLKSKAVNKSLYLNMIKAPDLGFFSLKPFENKWIILPNSDELSKNPLTSSYLPTKDIPAELTEEQKQHIIDITKKASFVKITGKHLPEIINGQLAFHFDFVLDNAGIIAYAKEINTYIKSINKESAQMPEVDDSEYNKMFNSLKDFHGEAWVGILDHLPHKALVSFSITNPEKSDDGAAKFSMTMTYNNWNGSMTVETPKDATTIEQLMSSFLASGMPKDETSEDMKTKAKADEDTFKKSIMTNMPASGEIFYNNNKDSYKGFCSSKTGAYPSAIRLPEGSIYKCNDESAKWASWVKLSTNDYFCVDYLNTAKQTKSGPGGTTCGL